MRIKFKKSSFKFQVQKKNSASIILSPADVCFPKLEASHLPFSRRGGLGHSFSQFDGDLKPRARQRNLLTQTQCQISPHIMLDQPTEES